MKKLIVVACIISIAFFGLAYDSFGQGAPVVYLEAPIDDLEIDFGPNPLLVELPGMDPLNVKSVKIVAPGREHLVITESGQYNYWADLGPGVIYATTLDYKKNGKPTEVIIRIEIKSASISEHYTIQDPENPDDVPLDSVNLYFKATLVLDGEPFDFALKL